MVAALKKLTKKFISGFCKDTGSALIYVLILSVILSIILCVIFSFSILHRQLLNRKFSFLQSRNTAWSAAAARTAEIETEQNKINFSLRERKSIKIAHKDSCGVLSFRWGAFWKLRCDSRKNTESYHLEMLMGRPMSAEFVPAIITAPSPHPLILTGKTSISGEVKTGTAGVRKGHLGNTRYLNKNLVNGVISLSTEERRPAIDRKFCRALFSFMEHCFNCNSKPFSDYITNSGNSIFFSDNVRNLFPVIFITDRQINSKDWNFSGPAILLASEPMIIRRPLTLNNYVMLASTHSISLEAPVYFENVILYTPKNIEIKQISQFSGQIFSRASIIIHNRIILDYPSLIMVNSETGSSSIQIQDSAKVAGWVLYTCESRNHCNKGSEGNITIGKEATVNGLVYSDLSVQLMGSVNGMVITESFHLYRNGAVYHNWIMDGTVNRFRLNDDNFSLPLFFFNKRNKLCITTVK